MLLRFISSFPDHRQSQFVDAQIAFVVLIVRPLAAHDRGKIAKLTLVAVSLDAEADFPKPSGNGANRPSCTNRTDPILMRAISLNG